ncbi:MAG: peptidylprolyl isomerase, partial [Phycisphaerae bacterium]|nr:peptidylprolyl isomerase [Gemmatimonadaceae bacterium]
MTNSNSLERLFAGAAIAAALSVSAITSTAVKAQTQPPAAVKGDSARNEALVINRVVAVVNTEPIMLSEIMDRVIKMRQAAQQTALDSATVVAMQAAALQEAIDDLLLLQKAKTEKVEIAEADVVQAAAEDFKEVRARFGTDAEFARALRESGFGSIDEFRQTREADTRNAMIKRDLMGKMRQSGRIPAVNVSEAEVTAEYERNKGVLPKREASASFRQIIFPVDPSAESRRKARAKIDSIAKELETRPQDFENVAKRESMDGSRDLGGDLGWTRRGATVPEFDRVIFAMNPGIISPVVETVYGFHLIRVDRVQAAEVKARHILIKFPIDTTDEERAFKLADSVATAWRAGAIYDTLSAQFHDDKNNEAHSIPDFVIATLPVSYQTAIKDRKTGDIVGPFTIHDERNNIDKPVVMQIT